MADSHPGWFQAATWSLALFYLVAIAAALKWVISTKKEVRAAAQAGVSPAPNPKLDRAYGIWILLGALAPACYLVGYFGHIAFSTEPLTQKPVTDVEARKIITERSDVRVKVWESLSYTNITFVLPEAPRTAFIRRANESLFQSLAESKRPFETVKVKEYGYFAWLVRATLPLVSTLLVVATAALLIRRPGTKTFEAQAIATPRAEKRELRVITIIAGLGLIVWGITLALMVEAHMFPKVPSTEAARLISDYKDSRIEAYRYSDGSAEISFNPPRIIISPADESAFALLNSNHVSYLMFVQGRDFGYGIAGKWTLFGWSAVLVVGAGLVLWRLRRKSV